MTACAAVGVESHRADPECEAAIWEFAEGMVVSPASQPTIPTITATNTQTGSTDRPMKWAVSTPTSCAPTSPCTTDASIMSKPKSHSSTTADKAATIQSFDRDITTASMPAIAAKA